MAIKGTTIFAIRHKDKMAMAGDGQVTLGNQVVMKHSARKVRRLFDDKVVARVCRQRCRCIHTV